MFKLWSYGWLVRKVREETSGSIIETAVRLISSLSNNSKCCDVTKQTTFSEQKLTGLLDSGVGWCCWVWMVVLLDGCVGWLCWMVAFGGGGVGW